MTQYRLKAYAKVNVGLTVTGRRSDGYHLISSYFLRIPLHDDILVTFSPGDGIVIRGNESYIGNGTDIMEKAMRLYREETGSRIRAEITIRKNIPSEAGLGGGSSDAAAILRAVNDFTGLLDESRLRSLSLSCGADVPFFLSGERCAYVSGIGEEIRPAEFPSFYTNISLFRPEGKGVSTGDAYRKLDALSIETRTLGKLEYPLRRSSFPNVFEKVQSTALYDSLSPETDALDYLSLSGSGNVWFLLSRNAWSGSDSRLIWTGPLFVD